MSDVRTSLDISGGILVGHDGSAAAGQAVRWAADWARRSDNDLHVLRTWAISSAPRPASWSPGYVPPMTDFEQAVLDRLRADVEALDLPPDGLRVECHVLHGSAGKHIVQASEQADLVVLGARGVGGFRGLMLGSTADQVVRHSRCPVVILPVHMLEPGRGVEPDSQLTDSSAGS